MLTKTISIIINFGYLATQCVISKLLAPTDLHHNYDINYYYNNIMTSNQHHLIFMHNKFITIRNRYLYTAQLAVLQNTDLFYG